MSETNVALVAGAQGVSGSAAVRHWSAIPDARVYGLSRRKVDAEDGAKHISVDLLDVQDVRQKLVEVRGVTHVVFGAYIEKPTATERSQVNVAILSNLPNDVAKMFGNQLYVPPSWMPIIEFPWRIAFGTVVTFAVAVCFRTDIASQKSYREIGNT